MAAMKRLFIAAAYISILMAVAIALWFIITNSRAMTPSPKYTVIEKSGDFEIREYPSLQLVSTGMSPDGRGMDGAFGRLFRFISGSNEEGREISMTTPVIVEGLRGETGTMSFILPDALAAEAPTPDEESVTLRPHPAGRFAVLRFSGAPDAAAERRAIEALDAELKKRALVPQGKPFFAFYDPPWTPDSLRRNEVLVRIAH